jgi:N6-L-threonylcarbamoyladenine synthase
VASQASIHETFGGVVPEVASRNHIMAVRKLVREVLLEADLKLEKIDAFAATAGPGLVSSLLIGTTIAKALAVSTQKPFLAINHIEGHLLSPLIGIGLENLKLLLPETLGLVVSGGHTQLIQIEGIGKYQVIGKTRDDAAGEAFDKIAKMLGLPYPGGRHLESLARHGDSKKFTFPRSLFESDSLEFSFSGLKTAVRYELQKHQALSTEMQCDICASAQQAIVEVIVEKAKRGLKLTKAKYLAVSGGVVCNQYLRMSLEEMTRPLGVTLYLADPPSCTDNAAMIAYTAAMRFAIGQSHPLTFEVNPSLPL